MKRTQETEEEQKEEDQKDEGGKTDEQDKGGEVQGRRYTVQDKVINSCSRKESRDFRTTHPQIK